MMLSYSTKKSYDLYCLNLLDLLHKSSLALVTALVEVNELVLLQEIYY